MPIMAFLICYASSSKSNSNTFINPELPKKPLASSLSEMYKKLNPEILKEKEDEKKIQEHLAPFAND